MDENEFESNGSMFYAKHNDSDNCDGCAFLSGRECSEFSAPCEGCKRVDGKNVIFVEKHQ